MNEIYERHAREYGAPAAPGPIPEDFYSPLEREYGYGRSILEASYLFRDGEEARRAIGFFFGSDMAARVTGPMVPEFAGLWHYRH